MKATKLIINGEVQTIAWWDAWVCNITPVAWTSWYTSDWTIENDTLLLIEYDDIDWPFTDSITIDWQTIEIVWYDTYKWSWF